MTDTSRRGLLKMIGTAVPLAAGLKVNDASAETARTAAAREVTKAAAAGKAYVPRFFTAHEWQTVRVLSDLVIPKDERSGSATDALVPEFIDQWMLDPLSTDRERESRQTALRGGLAWLDNECTTASRASSSSTAATPSGQGSWTTSRGPKKARPEMSQGVAFFTGFRDLVASGFWSSKMGVEDLDYRGNVFVAEWKGPPAEVLQKLGLPTD